MLEHLAQPLGWTGTFLILAAYALVTWKKIHVDHPLYPLLNLIGALCLGVNVYHLKAWPALVLEIVWGAIALTGLLKKP